MNFKKIDIIIEARMRSTRLPGKVLLEAINKPMLSLMIERLKKVRGVSDIIIATTMRRDDDRIESLAKKEGVSCYRGSENDVLGRVIKCALHYGTDIIVEITGDNPLSDPIVTSNMITKFLDFNGSVDFLSNDIGCYNNSVPISFPLGINVKIFKTSLLLDIGKKTNSHTDREHVVNYILKNINKYRTYDYKAKGKYSRPDLRFTMDYKEDYLLIKKVFEHFKNNNFTGLDVIDFLDSNPDVKLLNNKCIQSTYD